MKIVFEVFTGKTNDSLTHEFVDVSEQELIEYFKKEKFPYLIYKEEVEVKIFKVYSE